MKGPLRQRPTSDFGCGGVRGGGVKGTLKLPTSGLGCGGKVPGGEGMSHEAPKLHVRLQRRSWLGT